MRNALILSVLLLCSFSSASSQSEQPLSDYLWPTNASKYLTSAFGEYRARRFHAGLDIRTWGKTGYKVFAIRPGYVWRVGVSPFGYGKVLYVRLDTGEVAVFAHLMKFSDKIQKLVEAEQQRRGRYRVNMYLNPGQLPVQQGEVIAYSGQTGIGAPHLHFEIRDRNNNPINPLSKGYRLPDTVSPIVRKISFSPLDERSEVNGDYEPVILTPRWQSRGRYVVDEPVDVWGDVGLGVSCFDKGLNSSSRFGVYSLKLYVDDVLRFQYAYDRMTFQENPMVELERDYRLSRRNLGRFYKLYKDRHNTRSIYRPNTTWAGVLRSASLGSVTGLTLPESGSTDPDFASGSLFPGEHDFRVEVADYFGNTTSVSGKILVGAAYDIKPEFRTEEDNRLVVENIYTYELKDISDLQGFYFSRQGWRPLAVERIFSDLEKGGEGLPGETATSEMPVFVARTAVKPRILKFYAEDQFQARSYPYFFIEPKLDAQANEPGLTLHWDFFDAYARLQIDTDHLLAGVPAVTLYPGRKDSLRIKMHQRDLKTFIGRIPLQHLRGRFHLLRLTCRNLHGDRFTKLRQFEANVVPAGQKAALVSDDKRFRVKFWTASLFDSFYGKIVIDSSSVAGSQLLASSIYSVEPRDVLLNKGAYVHLQYARTEPAPEKLGVYYRTRRGRWAFIDNIQNPKTREVSAKVLSFEDFALLRDEEPPVIARLSPRDGALLKTRRPQLAATVEDKLCGIASEEDVELWLDGRKLISEYDPERKRVRYRVRRDLTVGPHTFKVVVRDKVKNTAVKEVHFTVQ